MKFSMVRQLYSIHKWNYKRIPFVMESFCQYSANVSFVLVAAQIRIIDENISLEIKW